MKRIMTHIVILFFILPAATYSQCKNQSQLEQSVTIEDVSDGIDHYYQNLIVQDIAISRQQPFREVTLKLDYKLSYLTDQCLPDRIEIRVLPVKVKCTRLIYEGFDISSSIRPENADLVFYLTEQDGYVSDSLVFFNIAVEKDSGLYTSLTWIKDDTSSHTAVSFGRAVFHYTKYSYEVFRDRLLQIDNYHAASLVADSALYWISDGFLAETTDKPRMIMRQMELERIINHINPLKFSSFVATGQDDILGLEGKYRELLRMSTRYSAIISYDLFNYPSSGHVLLLNEFLNDYIDRFDYYDRLAFRTDFRFVNFIEGLATPVFNNADLAKLYALLEKQRGWADQSLHQWAGISVMALVDRGDRFAHTGNQLRAITYFSAAYKLSLLTNQFDYQPVVFRKVGNMKKEIAASYTEISRKAALSDNPVLAVQYFQNAKKMFSEQDFMCFEPGWLKDYEGWLFQNLVNQAVINIDRGNYSKALGYLNEIQNYCIIENSYPLPEKFHSWMRTVRDGIYHNLLDKAQNLLQSEETAEAVQVFRSAVGMRLTAGYRISKDLLESKLEVAFRQLQYEELIDEGIRYYAKDEFSPALYYFNKADLLERLSLNNTYPRLFTYRQNAARQVIVQFLSEGRIRAWAYDFKGAQKMLNQTEKMLEDYRIGKNDSLTAQYKSLEENVSRRECEKIFADYKNLVALADSAVSGRDYILALRTFNEAVDLSLAHLDCRIKDDEAWYQKVMMEAPAAFQEMERELEALSENSCIEYLVFFQKLKNYYYHKKLLQQGVVFVPLFDRVVMMKDTSFLTCMLNHYLMLKDHDHSLLLLKRLQELGTPAGQLKLEQKSLGASLARRDAMNEAIAEPWETMGSYTEHGEWYRSFKWSYKFSWLKAKDWKLKYWPLIWKK
jgi:hypothetical protein